MKKQAPGKSSKDVKPAATDSSGTDPVNTGHNGSGDEHVKTGKSKTSGKVKR
jgi:hypothetical protein